MNSPFLMLGRKRRRKELLCCVAALARSPASLACSYALAPSSSSFMCALLIMDAICRPSTSPSGKEKLSTVPWLSGSSEKMIASTCVA